MGLRITKFGTERRMVTQATCTPSVVVPELKSHQVLQPRHRHEEVVDMVGHVATTIVPIRPAQFTAKRLSGTVMIKAH